MREPHASSAEIASPQPRDSTRLWDHRFRGIWAGATISSLGDQFYLVALPWLVLQLNSSSATLGSVLMAAAVPRAVLMLFGGAAIDRFTARTVLLVTTVARTVFVGALAALCAEQLVRGWHVYLLALLFGTADAFAIPAAPALVPRLVEQEGWSAANASMQMSAQMAQMFGPALGGLIVTRWGVPKALLLDTISFLPLVLALLLIRGSAAEAPGQTQGAIMGVLRSVADGLTVVRRDQQLRIMAGLATLLNFCVVGPMAVGVAVLAKEVFGSSTAYGLLFSAFGCGALGGTLLARTVRWRRRRGALLLTCLVITGLGLSAIGAAPAFRVVSAALCVIGAVVCYTGAHTNAWVQERSKPAFLGRVMSVLTLGAAGFAPLSYALVGALAEQHLTGVFIWPGAVLIASAIAATLLSATVEIV